MPVSVGMMALSAPRWQQAGQEPREEGEIEKEGWEGEERKERKRVRDCGEGGINERFEENGIHKDSLLFCPSTEGLSLTL